MGDPSQPASGRARVAVLVGLLAILAGGVGLGVLLDRLWLRPTRTAAQDPRLLGRWVEEEDKTPLEFKTDGTFEYVRVTIIEVPVLGPRPDDIKKEQVRKEEPVTGQYRWVNDGTLELLETDFGGLWMALRFVIEGDRLTLLRTDGSVRRYNRSR